MVDAVQADFDFQGGSLIVGGADGEAVLHSSLINPLAGEGLYCRRFRHPNNTFTRHLMTYSAAFNGGNFYGIPDTFAISIRAWLRVQDNLGNASGYIGLIVHTTDAPFGDNPLNGYMVSLGDWDGSSENQPLRLRLQTFNAGLVVKSQTVDIGAVNDTWYKVRMDVIPTSGVEDTLRMYTGTGATGSEVWVQQGADITVPSGDGDFAGWGGSRATGIRTRSQTSIPFGYDAYIDRLQTLLTQAP